MEGWRHWCRYWRGGNRRCWKINNTTHVLQDSHCFGYQHSWRFFCPSPGCRRLLSSIGKAFFKLTSFVNSRWECFDVFVWVYLTYMSTLLLLQDYRQQRPSQELVAKDLHGIEWKFRHIYRGTTDCYSWILIDWQNALGGFIELLQIAGQPRRHLLTTGWSAFVNRKKLVSGDAVLFLRCQLLNLEGFLRYVVFFLMFPSFLQDCWWRT